MSASTRYFYRVFATSTAGDSSATNIASATTLAPPAPSAPSGLTALAASSAQINLTWVDTASNETGFRVERAAATSGPWSAIASVGANVQAYSSTGLSASTVYFYRVFATGSSGDSNATNVASATTLAAAGPGAPSGLTATTASSAQINLAWVDNATNETGFKIERATSSAGPWTQVAAPGVNSTFYPIYSLTASTTYYFRVRATNGTVDSAYSAVASATTSVAPPAAPNAAPTSVTATALSSSQIRIAWTDGCTNETAYIVERAVGAVWAQIASLPMNTTSYTDSGLNASSTYTYRVSTSNSGGTRYSSLVSATTQAATVTIPNVPTGLTATVVSSSQINVSWADASTNETGFNLERATSSAGPFTTIATTGSNVTAYSSTGLAGSTTYYFRVSAFNTGGSSAYTPTVSATTSAAVTIPAVPSSVAATAASGSQINLSWSGSATSFKVERATSAIGPWSQIGTTAATTYQDTSLASCSTWFYHVCACNAQGGCSVFSSAVSAATATGIPPAPINLSATAASTTQINLAWTGGAGCAATSYKIERAAASAGPWTQIATTAGTTYQNTALSAATPYYYRVRAANTTGDSAYSSITNTTTLSASGVPGALAWAQRLGGTSVDMGRAIATDANRNIVVAGTFMGTTDLGSGSLTSAGGMDVFIAKFSPTGAALWSVRYGGANEENVYGMALDGSGNVLVLGTFSGDTNLGGSTLTSAGNTDIFIAKYSATGSHIWSKRVGAASIDTGCGIATDASGNVFVSGTFAGTIDFGAMVVTGSSGGDGFLAKYASDGTNLWARKFVNSAADVPSKITTDASGDLLVTGYFSGSINFGTLSGTLLVSAGAEDLFVAKVSGSDGAHIWSKRFGADRSDMGRDVKVDGSGNVLVTGFFYNTVDFGGGAMTSSGFQEIFLAKLSGTDGAQMWSRSMGGIDNDEGDSLAVDANNNVIVSGTFSQTAGFGGTPLVSTGGNDMFVAKYSSGGTALWSRGEGSDVPGFVAVDSIGNVSMTGYFNGTNNFGQGLLTSAGSADVFLLSIWP